MANEKPIPVPPYLPLKTFFGALDALREVVPSRIDRAIWRSQSGATQTQIMVTFRFFGLINDSDAPALPLLENLAKADETERKKLLRALVEKKYSAIVALDLTKMTPSLLSEQLAKFGVSGDTLRKASTFFLQIAKFVDLPISPYLTVRASALRARRTPRTQNQSAPPASNGVAQPPAAEGSTTSVNLKGGGNVTMTVTADVWKMPAEDRKFVLELVDKIQGYEEAPADKKPKEKAAKA
jgi:hypothetical protein